MLYCMIVTNVLRKFVGLNLSRPSRSHFTCSTKKGTCDGCAEETLRSLSVFLARPIRQKERDEDKWDVKTCTFGSLENPGRGSSHHPSMLRTNRICHVSEFLSGSARRHQLVSLLEEIIYSLLKVGNAAHVSFIITTRMLAPQRTPPDQFEVLQGWYKFSERHLVYTLGKQAGQRSQPYPFRTPKCVT